MDADRFSTHSLFAGLKPDETAHILGLMPLTGIRRGEHLFHTGDVAESAFILRSGTVKVSYFNPGGDEKIINIYQAGDLFGHLFLGQYHHRIGTAVALEDSTAGRLTQAVLNQLVTQHPGFALNLVAYLADEQRQTLARLHALMHLSARDRLLGTLLHLARRFCCTHGTWSQLPGCITQDDIANLACLNRSTVNIHINALRETGVLGGKGRTIVVNSRLVESLLRETGLEILQ